MSVHREFAGFLGPDLREVEAFLSAFCGYPALPLALALKGIPRLEMVSLMFPFGRLLWNVAVRVAVHRRSFAIRSAD
jgi:hypothetical protein